LADGRTVLLLAVGATASFVVLTALVALGATGAIDEATELAAQSADWDLPLPRLTRLVLVAASPVRALAVTLALAAVLSLVVRQRRHLGRAVLAIGLWVAITLALKHGLGRPLPTGNPIRGLAYPSGHMGGATVLAGLVVLAACERVTTAWLRWSVIAAAVSLPAAVATFLIAGDQHWLTDVIGGALLAIACLTWSMWSWPKLFQALFK
jgi:membrane-associated phospholipid phosphatase